MRDAVPWDVLSVLAIRYGRAGLPYCLNGLQPSAGSPIKLRMHNSSVLWRSLPPCVVFTSVQQVS